MTDPALQVDQLEVDFPTKDGVVHAVRGISFSLASREVLGIVGESGSGKSVTALAAMGLLPKGAQIRGSIKFRGREVLGLKEKQLTGVRGTGIAMIFQDPMTSLNPVYTIGWQIVEAIRAHQRPQQGAGRGAGHRAAQDGGYPQPRRARQQLPARVLGRHAPACRDRHRHGQRPRGDPGRRAHDRARRDGAGTGARLSEDGAGRDERRAAC